MHQQQRERERENLELNSMEGSSKRQPPPNSSHYPEYKRPRFLQADPPSQAAAVPPPSAAVTRVVLNPADCDLDFIVKEDGLHGSALYEQGFAYCWSGARANVGINGGRYCFGCKIVAAQPVDMDDIPFDQQHICRLGISRGDDAVGNLGETRNSFGFGGTGKFSNGGIFCDYGETFGVGDTIICCVDLDCKPVASIGFAKNGKWLGIAKQFDAGPSGLQVVDSPLKLSPWESAIFPHVLLKNVIVQLQFSTEDGLVPLQGYRPWASTIGVERMIMGPTFSNSSDCELIMMVGLPACGKTTWAEKWVSAHPEKRYIILGTNLALDHMKVPGLQRKHNYGERFDRLMDRATGIFNTLLSRASKMPRNFIVDQTNVYKSARRRKLKPFADYHKIAVVVFPRPEAIKFRADKRFREMGKEVPIDAVDEMLANYSLPMSKDMHATDEYFDEVWFPELNRDESQRCLDEMKANLRLNKDASISREGSFQSYSSPQVLVSRGKSIESCTGPLVQNQGSIPGIGGQWPSPFSTHPPIGAPPISYHSVSSGYPGGNSYPHEYQTYVAGNAYSHPSYGSGNLLPRGAADFSSSQMVDHCSGMPAFPYNSGNAYAGQSLAPPDLSATRATTFRPPVPAQYGSSFGTAPLMPPQGSFPGDTLHMQWYETSPLRPPHRSFLGDTLHMQGFETAPFRPPPGSFHGDTLNMQGDTHHMQGYETAPLRPPHGSFPGDTHNTQGYAPPRPGYF